MQKLSLVDILVESNELIFKLHFFVLYVELLGFEMNIQCLFMASYIK